MVRLARNHSTEAFIASGSGVKWNDGFRLISLALVTVRLNWPSGARVGKLGAEWIFFHSKNGVP